jgi:hypothetical protein
MTIFVEFQSLDSLRHPFEMPKPIWKNHSFGFTLAFCNRKIYHDRKNTSEFPDAMSERIFELTEPPSTFAESKHKRTTTRKILTKGQEIQSETVEGAPSTHSHIDWITQESDHYRIYLKTNNDDEPTIPFPIPCSLIISPCSLLECGCESAFEE